MSSVIGVDGSAVRSSAGLPSVLQGTSTPAALAIVGRMSTVRTAASSTAPARCPGRLTITGTEAMSAQLAFVGWRRGSPARNEAPWSEVTTITALS